MKECSFYPDAHSMILAEKGILKMNYSSDGGWKYTLHTTVRKKIFTSEDSDGGNIRLRLYTPENGALNEEIYSFKAFSYNLVNGEIEREKINFKDVHRQKLSKNFTELNYIIPGIKDGTVIEYQYQKRSDYISNLSTWYFQGIEVPVAYSEFSFTIPEWFNYHVNQLGNQIEGEWTSKTINESFLIQYRSSDGSSPYTGPSTRRVSSNIKSLSKQRKGVFRNILPITEEPFTPNLSDIPARLEFQLISIDYPDQPKEIIAGTYQKFNRELIENTSFGKRFDKGKFLNEDIIFKLKQKNPAEKAAIIFYHLQNELSWVKTHDYFSDSSGKVTYKKKEGTVADINLSLLAALRAHDIKAFPVILSTRGHGTVHPIYPNYDEFNYVIVLVEIEGKRYFADASSQLPFGELPLKCRNGNGWLVKEEEGEWIDLKSNSNYSTISLINLKVKEDYIEIDVTQRRKNYASYSKIDELYEATEDELQEVISSQYVDFEIIDFDTQNEGYSKPLTLKYTLRQSLEENGVIYLEPLVMGTIKKNPFTREKRETAIDFPYVQEMNVIASVEIPEGYTAELPESGIVRLPKNGGKFEFIVKQVGNRINIRSNLKINQTYFENTEYLFIKEFYDLVSVKNNEVIVLTKL